MPSEHVCEAPDDEQCKDDCRQRWDICFKTQVAVRAELLTANEWEYFVANGEDLSGDKSAAVGKWLAPVLQKYRHRAHGAWADLAGQTKGVDPPKVKDVKAGGHGLAIQILTTRWLQHVDAIGSAIDTLTRS